MGCVAAVGHRVFGAGFSFRWGWRTVGGGLIGIFRSFLLVLAGCSFWERGGMGEVGMGTRLSFLGV